MANKYFNSEDITRWMKGSRAAIDFAETMCNIAHIWDDLIDKDTEVSNSDINKVFFDILVRLPRNEFYRKNFEHLNSILVNAISNWLIATNLEKQGEDYETSIAFVLRSSYVDLITQAALILGGQEWATVVGEEVRKQTHGETYTGYLNNLKIEVDNREKIKKEKQNKTTYKSINNS